MNGFRLATFVVLVLVVVAARGSLRTWGNPVSALAGPFALTLAWQQATIPEVPFGANAALLVMGGAMALFFGTAVSTRLALNRATADLKDTLVSVRPRTVRMAVWAAIAISYLYLAYGYLVVEVRRTSYVGDVFYREAFLEGAGSGPLYRAAQLLMYVGAMLVALDAVQRGLRRKEPLLFLAGAIGQSIVLSTKSSILIILSIFAAVWALTNAHSLRRLLTPRHLLVAGFLVVIGGYTFSAVTTRRAGSDARVGSTFVYSFAGPSAALSMVVDQGFEASPAPRFGRSVGGLRELIGRGEREIGVYRNSVVLTPGEYPSTINVYTWYLPLLEDLGVAGALGAIFTVGLISGPLFVRARGGRLSVTALVVLTCLVVLLLWSPIVMLSYYNFWFVLLILAPAFGALFKNRVASRPASPLALVGSLPGIRRV